MKNCERAATVATGINLTLLTSAIAPPPSALKNVIALVIAASITAFPQSNFFTFWVSLFVQ
jgi:hypothetical protein